VLDLLGFIMVKIPVLLFFKVFKSFSEFSEKPVNKYPSSEYSPL